MSYLRACVDSLTTALSYKQCGQAFRSAGEFGSADRPCTVF